MGVDLDQVESALLARKAESRAQAAKRYESLVLDVLNERVGTSAKDLIRIEETLQAVGAPPEALKADVSRLRLRAEAEKTAKLLPGDEESVRETRRKRIELDKNETRRRTQYLEQCAELDKELDARNSILLKHRAVVEAAEREGGPLENMCVYHSQARLRKLTADREAMQYKIASYKREQLSATTQQLEEAREDASRRGLQDTPELQRASGTAEVVRSEYRGLQNQLAGIEQEIAALSAELEPTAAHADTARMTAAVR